MTTIEKIVRLLKEKGLEQQDLTSHIGVKKSVFSAWKSGVSRSYNKYLPEISELLGVSIDWLLGNTKYRDEKLKSVYEWDIYTVSGFDPVFDFGALYEARRKEHGVSKEDAAKSMKLKTTEQYDEFMSGWKPLMQADATNLCKLLGTTPEDILRDAGVYSATPTEQADISDEDEPSEENPMELADRFRIKGNIVYLAKREGDTLKNALDKIGIVGSLYDDLNRGYSYNIRDMKKVAEHYGVGFKELTEYDLTKETGRILAGLFREKDIEAYDVCVLTTEQLEYGCCPYSHEMPEIAEALEMDVLDIPLPAEELLALPAKDICMTEAELELLRSFRRLNEKGQEKAKEYLGDIAEIYAKE